jgi:NAD(P)-dependent dehydrogenase (short-subunit alcohol dehydrogenase family)
MGAHKGVPYMANDGGAKAYVQSFSEGLHVELDPLGVHVTVLPPGPTDTPVIAKFGLTPAVPKLCPNRICGSRLGCLLSEKQIPQIAVNIWNRRKTMEPLEPTQAPWAQGSGVQIAPPRPI